jgi:hypothetical protein
VVAVVMIVLLILVAVVRKGRLTLTPDAAAEFRQWMFSHPKAREREQRCSGIRDITEDPARFFAFELREPEHADVLKTVREAGGVVDISAVRRWIAENTDEVYNRNLTTCDVV